MARVFLTTTGDNAAVANSADDYLRVRESAENDRCGRHALVDSPRDADVILFVGAREPDHLDVRLHPLVRAYRERCFLYHSEDAVFPFLPGVYPSLLRRDDLLGRAIAGGYSAVLHIDIPFLPFDPAARYLFSFRGSLASHPVRSRLKALSAHPRGFFEDLSQRVAAGGWHSPGAHREIGVELMRSSKFCLCPRGRGPSTWRLYETLRAGRVPVIVSDQWNPPPIGCDWESATLRVRERDVASIPRILEEREADAEQLARQARRIWDEWFSMDAFFHRVVEWCESIASHRRLPERYGRVLAAPPLARPFNLRRFVIPRIRKAVSRVPVAR